MAKGKKYITVPCETYVDGSEASAVASGHVGVQGLDGVGARHLTVLLVHVVGAGARVVADPDAEVLDLLGVLLVELRLFVRSERGEEGKILDLVCEVRTTLTETISPVAFLTFFRPRRKYQKRDLATTSLGAKMVMR